MSKSGQTPEQLDATMFLTWLNRHRFDSLYEALRNAENPLNRFIRSHGIELLEYCNTLFHAESGGTDDLDVHRFYDPLHAVVIQMARAQDENRAALSQPAQEILKAYDRFHEIALYRELGLVRIGLTTADEKDLKGIEYVHGFDELRYAGYICHNTGRIWYFTERGSEALKKQKDTG